MFQVGYFRLQKTFFYSNHGYAQLAVLLLDWVGVDLGSNPPHPPMKFEDPATVQASVQPGAPLKPSPIRALPAGHTALIEQGAEMSGKAKFVKDTKRIIVSR